MSILIVDDSEDMRLLLWTVLHEVGYGDLQMADSAQEALRILENGDSEIDLILMDVVMPGTDGIEASRQIKGIEKLHDIPIIMVTAMNETKLLEAAFETGATDYITKPLNRVKLLARVRATLRLKQEIDACRAHEKELERKNRELKEALCEIELLRKEKGD